MSSRHALLCPSPTTLESAQIIPHLVEAPRCHKAEALRSWASCSMWCHYTQPLISSCAARPGAAARVLTDLAFSFHPFLAITGTTLVAAPQLCCARTRQQAGMRCI